MTEQNTTYIIPNNAELRTAVFSDEKDPNLAEAQMEARAVADYQGELREVRPTDPEARIDLHEEATMGPYWEQQEAEKRLLEQRQYQAKLSHEDKLSQSIDNIPSSEYLDFAVNDITQVGVLITNFRAYKAA